MQNKLKKALFLSLFIILPFLFNPFTGDIELIKVVFLCILTLILLIYAVLFIKDKIKHNKQSKLLVGLLVGFIMIATISVFTNDVVSSLFGIYGRYLGFIAWFSCIMIALVTPYYIRDSKLLKKLIKSLIWVGFVSAIAAIVLSFLDIGAIFEGRLSGLTGNPNVLGKLLLFTIVLNVVHLAYVKQKMKILYISTLIAQLIVFMLTGNRASWLALGIIVVVLMVRNARKYLKYAAIIIAASIPFAYFVLERLLNTVSIGTRLEIYQKAISKLFERGLFGYGFDFSPTLLIPNESYTYSVDRAHQLFLDVGLNVGIPGLILFAIFSIISIYQLIKDENYYYNAFGYGLLALFISLQFSYFSSISLLLYFLCIGVNLQRLARK